MSKRLIPRWATVKGLTAIILFVMIAALIEWGIVVYAISLGVKDQNLLQGSFQLPGTGWTITIGVSPLFHLVPLSVIIVLVFSWICMIKYAAMQHPKPLQVKPKTKLQKERPSSKKEKKLGFRINEAISGFLGRIKSRLLKSKRVSYVWGKVSFAKATIKTALLTILVFSAIILLISVIAYPKLIYGTFSNLYKCHPSLLQFVISVNNVLRDVVEVIAPIGWLCSSINNAIMSAGPAVRGFASVLGGSVKPLVDLSPIGKYLVFQNVAAWASAFAAFTYGFFTRKGYRLKKAK